MKVMILAAGRGERLRPLTDHMPKPLVQAGPHRLIEYLIYGLVKAGFTEMVINYAHLGEQFPQLLGNGEQYGAKIEYSPELNGGLETAGGIINALPMLGNEPFLVVNGDIWTDFPFERLQQFELSQNVLCHLILVDNPSHNTAGDFALGKNGLVTDTGSPRYTFSGIGIYHPRFFADMDPGKRPLKPLFLQAIASQQASGELYRGAWSDIGTIERLHALIKDLTAI